MIILITVITLLIILNHINQKNHSSRLFSHKLPKHHSIIFTLKPSDVGRQTTKKVSLTKDDIRAYSTNEETYADGSLIHPPFDIPMELIFRIFEVLGYVVKKGSGTMVTTNRDKM